MAPPRALSQPFPHACGANPGPGRFDKEPEMRQLTLEEAEHVSGGGSRPSKATDPVVIPDPTNPYIIEYPLNDGTNP